MIPELDTYARCHRVSADGLYPRLFQWKLDTTVSANVRSPATGKPAGSQNLQSHHTRSNIPAAKRTKLRSRDGARPKEPKNSVNGGDNINNGQLIPNSPENSNNDLDQLEIDLEAISMLSCSSEVTSFSLTRFTR